MTRIYAYISPELKQALEKTAKAQERSESFIVVKALEKYLTGKQTGGSQQ